MPRKPNTLAPMEAESVDEIPVGDRSQYEPKWDGFRCIAFRNRKPVERGSVQSTKSSAVVATRCSRVPVANPATARASLEAPKKCEFVGQPRHPRSAASALYRAGNVLSAYFEELHNTE
jgi:hypothetical protein